VEFCRRPSPFINIFTFITLSFRSGWLPERQSSATFPVFVRRPLDHEGPRSGSCPQQTEAVERLPPAGRAVHSPRRPVSWVKFCPTAVLLSIRSARYPSATGPPEKIFLGISDLRGMALFATSRAAD
jgi:hypothetical protein